MGNSFLLLPHRVRPFVPAAVRIPATGLGSGSDMFHEPEPCYRGDGDRDDDKDSNRDSNRKNDRDDDEDPATSDELTSTCSMKIAGEKYSVVHQKCI